jgi:hypothetical protein
VKGEKTLVDALSFQLEAGRAWLNCTVSGTRLGFHISSV